MGITENTHETPRTLEKAHANVERVIATHSDDHPSMRRRWPDHNDIDWVHRKTTQNKTSADTRGTPESGEARK